VQATDPSTPSHPASETAGWLRLSLTPGIGPQRVAQLLDRIGPPSRIFSASYDQLAAVVPPRLAHALRTPDAQLRARIDCAWDWGQQAGHRLFGLGDAAYPDLLRNIADPPTLLYGVGDPGVIARPCLAIVGSRNATVMGMKTTSAFAKAASEAGIAVVSGLALGIDTAAHTGALAACGSTVGVLATGVDRIYPARNQALYQRIAGDGCLLSEMPLGTAPEGGLFPRRNRIISGLATAVLVVEAAARSGSLVTARCALDQGRQVMAVPGSIHSALSKGCHLLIKEGATLVESIDDVIAALRPGGFVPNAPQQAVGEGVHIPLLALLGFAPTSPHDLAAATGSAVDTVISQLLSLELNGLVQRLPGGMFQRLSS
jgi:DNA processing protein